MGVLLAVGTWILRGTLFNGVIPGSNVDNLGGCIQGTHGVVQNWGNVQGILFLEVGLTENWLIFVTRGGGRLPSWQLVGAILGVDVCLFCLLPLPTSEPFLPFRSWAPSSFFSVGSLAHLTAIPSLHRTAVGPISSRL
jgi:hypothetical protein